MAGGRSLRVAGVSAATDRVWSVGEISQSLKGLLESTYGRLQVRGEISGLARPASGHLYFSLVHDRPIMGSRTSNPQIGAVMWRSNVGRLRVDPEDGMKVVVSGRLTTYESRSVYQLVAERIEPEGIGDLHLAFERLKEKLGAEGLFEEDRKLAIPFLPRRVGVITSPTGAAVRDFLKTLTQRNPGASVRLVPVRVQGDGAAAEIARAVELLGRPQADVDVIVVTRGGGSLEDLWAFNEEVVARAIAVSDVPVVSAVGHEVDFTIADFVADRRAATPTAAAAVVSPDLGELHGRLASLHRGLVQGLRATASSCERGLLRATSARLLQDPQLIVQERFGGLDRALEGLENHLYKRLEECHDSLILLGTRLRGLSPFAILDRGYSVALDRHGRPVRSASSLGPGDPVELRFAAGRARARVENVDTDGRAGSERDGDGRTARGDL